MQDVLFQALVLEPSLPAYVSECAPKEVRGRITGIFQIMVGFRATCSSPA